MKNKSRVIRSIAPVAKAGTRVRELKLKASWASSNFKIETVCLSAGPSYLEDETSVSQASHFLLEEVHKAVNAGCCGIIIDCFTDPLLEECRQISTIPIVGAGRSALCSGWSLGKSIAVIIPTERMQRFISKEVGKHGIPVARWDYVFCEDKAEEVIHSSTQKTTHALREAYSRCSKLADIDVIVLGCTALEPYWLEILMNEAEYKNLPVILPFRAAVMNLEMLIGNLRT